MRTKTLLIAAAALAAGLASSMAQNVYSQNVVGYVNKSFQNQFYVLVSNPLKNNTNSLKDLIPNPPDNTTVGRWNVGLQDLDPVVPTYSTFLNNWSPNSQINDGEGFFVVGGDPSGSFTNTFVGEVRQGTTTVAVAGNFNYQAIGSPVPISGYLSNILSGYVAADNDTIGIWNVANQDLDPAVPTYSTFLSAWVPDWNFAVADGFFLIRAGGPVNWNRNFTVN